MRWAILNGQAGMALEPVEVRLGSVPRLQHVPNCGESTFKGQEAAAATYAPRFRPIHAARRSGPFVESTALKGIECVWSAVATRIDRSPWATSTPRNVPATTCESQVVTTHASPKTRGFSEVVCPATEPGERGHVDPGSRCSAHGPSERPELAERCVVWTTVRIGPSGDGPR